MLAGFAALQVADKGLAIKRHGYSPRGRRDGLYVSVRIGEQHRTAGSVSGQNVGDDLGSDAIVTCCLLESVRHLENGEVLLWCANNL